MNKVGLYTAIVFILSIAHPHNLSAQSINITGIIKDAESRQSISMCSIGIINSNIGTSSDQFGKFSIIINLNSNYRKLIVSSIGYISDTIQLNKLQNDYLILLKPAKGILNDIVVTSNTKATLTRENPVAITTVSLKSIEGNTETNIIDVLVKNVPGLNAVKTGPNISKPFIRGLGYNRVLTLYDGIRQEGQQWGDEHGIEVDAYNIEKGEVIKGPASLMYGSDALAGVVSLIPPQPLNTDNKLKGKYFSEYQDNNGLVGNGLRLNIGNTHWGYSLSGSYRIARNYTNTVDGSVYNTAFRETNVSSTLKYTGNKGYSTLNFTWYNNLQGIPDGTRDSITRQFTKQIYEGDFDNIKMRPIVSDIELNSYQMSPLHQHIQHYRVYSNNHYQLNKGDINFLLSFQQNIRREYNHPTLPKQAGMFVQLNTVNYGLYYNAPKIKNVECTIGINGMYQENKNKDATDFPIPDYHLLDIGSFLFTKWKDKKWTISGGVRYDVRYLKGDNFYITTNTSTGFSTHVAETDTIASYLQFPSFNKAFNGISLSIGTTFQLSNNINIKANIARGYRAPSITEFASNGLDPGAHIVYLGNREFVPEFSLQQDLGADLHCKNITLSFSVFNNNIDHYIYLSQLTDANGNPVINSQGNKTYEYQQASAQLYGFELGCSIHPSLLRGFSFDNVVSNIYGFNRKSIYRNKGIEGEYLPLIPPAKLLSSINKEFKFNSKLFSNINFKAEMDINASQNRYLALNNTENQTVSFTLLNFSINTTIKYSKKNTIQLQLHVNNVLDKAYQSNLSRLKYLEYYLHSTSGHSGIYNMGRNIGLKLILPF